MAGPWFCLLEADDNTPHYHKYNDRIFIELLPDGRIIWESETVFKRNNADARSEADAALLNAAEAEASTPESRGFTLGGDDSFLWLHDGDDHFIVYGRAANPYSGAKLFASGTWTGRIRPLTSFSAQMSSGDSLRIDAPEVPLSFAGTPTNGYYVGTLSYENENMPALLAARPGGLNGMFLPSPYTTPHMLFEFSTPAKQ
jgi:hypothetical protein